MNREEAIKTLLKDDDSELSARLERIEFLLLQIGSRIGVTQKEACQMLEVTDDTMRNMALRGEIEPMQKDGSNRNVYLLTQIAGLKFRKQKKR